MSRTIKEIQLSQPIDVVSMMMDDFIYHNHFMRTDWEGEMVFFTEDSHGVEIYFMWSYTGGIFHTESWVKGLMGGEDSLAGLYHMSAKNDFAGKLNDLYRRLQTASGSDMRGGHIGTDPIHHDAGDHSNHQNWQKDTNWQQNSKGYTIPSTEQPRTVETYSNQRRTLPGQVTPENSALYLSFVALFLGMIIPWMGVIFAVIARKKARGTGLEKIIKILTTIAFFFIIARYSIMLIGLVFAALF